MNAAAFGMVPVIVWSGFLGPAMSSAYARTRPVGETRTATLADDHRRDFGWIGLLGLAGLANLVRRERNSAPTYTTTAPFADLTSESARVERALLRASDDPTPSPLQDPWTTIRHRAAGFA